MAAMFFCCSGLKSQTERETLRKMLRASSIRTWSRRASSFSFARSKNQSWQGTVRV